MSRFFVGQRVRLVKAAHAVNAGKTGVIKKLFPEIESKTYPINCDIEWDNLDVVMFSTCTHTSRLEPITDCYDLTTWDTCVWQPEHLRVTV